MSEIRWRTSKESNEQKERDRERERVSDLDTEVNSHTCSFGGWVLMARFWRRRGKEEGWGDGEREWGKDVDDKEERRGNEWRIKSD